MRLRFKPIQQDVIEQMRGPYCFYDGSSLPACPGTPELDTESRIEHSLYMADVVTPDYRKRSAAGEVIISPMISEEYYLKLKRGQRSVNNYFKDDLIYRSSNWVGDYSTTPVYLQNSGYESAIEDFLAPFAGERDIALTKAYSNVDESELLLYATLGEAPETVAWLASIYTRLIGILKAVKTRQLKAYLKYSLHSKADTAALIADSWMEARYAIRPLLFEAQQIIAALNVAQKPRRKTARGTHTSSETFDITHVNGTAHGTFTWDQSGFSRRESTYRAGVLYQIDSLDPNWMSVLGFDHPIQAVYELTKLSFALDWLINLGDKLAALTPSANLTPLGCWVKETHVFERQLYLNNFGRVNTSVDWSVEKLDSDYGLLEERHIITRRIARPELSVYPSVKINLNWLKCVDLAMIARQIYRALRKSWR